MELYLKKRDPGVSAVGEFDFAAGTMTVKKDSTVLEDVIFKSASTAANFVTGQSANGLSAWKDAKGRTLKELMSE